MRWIWMDLDDEKERNRERERREGANRNCLFVCLFADMTSEDWGMEIETGRRKVKINHR